MNTESEHDQAVNQVALVLDLLRRNEILTEALQFYASEWIQEIYCGPSQTLLDDRGERAKRALLK